MKSLRDQTLADYVVIALSPALIMALIGSLVYFLLEVLYQGEFQGRMRWILFFYVFGCVLVARVAMQSEIAARAPLYSLIMAVGAWVGLGMFVEYPPDLLTISWVINLGLVGLVWWSAQKLTWDCTFIDDQVDAGKAGLLQETGLEKPAQREPEQSAREEDDKLSWWERFVRYRDAQRKKHTPGTWIVYFSLAALPLFGLGQSLIPPEEAERRRYTFLLLAVYVASGLGLLLTTCFLGLRRYLRQRKVRMPAKMVGTWLTLGGGLIAALVVAGAILPRPNSETPLVDFNPLGSKKRDASQYAMMKDGGGKDKGQPGEASKQKDGSAQGKDAQGGNKGQGEKGSQGDGKQNSQGGSQKDGQSGNQKDSQGGKKDNSGEKGDKKDQGTKHDGGKKQDDGGSSSNDNPKDGKDQKAQKSDRGSSPPVSKTLFHHLPEMGRLGTILKWIVFGVLAAVVVFYVLRSGLQWLANFTNWARQLLESLRAFWARLFGRRETEVHGEREPTSEGKIDKRARPFSFYRNPFEDGSADRFPPDEVVRYSFMALQAWANERDLDRQAEETPLEFAARVGDEVPALAEDARQLTILYTRAVYAPGALPRSNLTSVERFWAKLEEVVEQPLSA